MAEAFFFLPARSSFFRATALLTLATLFWSFYRLVSSLRFGWVFLFLMVIVDKCITSVDKYIVSIRLLLNIGDNMLV
jgi:hypothetical protein